MSQQPQLPLSAEPGFQQRVAEHIERMKNDDREMSLVVSWASGQREVQDALKKMCRANNDRDVVACANVLRDLVETGLRRNAERTVRVTDIRKKMETDHAQP